MDGQGCWSTVVCSAEERRALGLSGSSEWLLQCRLAAGHAGNHATDASTRPRSDRRLWLEWNDFDDRAQSLIERNPCPVPSPEGARCVFFNGHGGPHFYARSNGHAPSPVPGNGGVRRAPGGVAPQPVGTPDQPQRSGPSTGDLPIAAGNAGSHRLDDPRGSSLREAPPAQQSVSSHSGSTHSGSTQSAAAHAYRGGRRSTNAEPPPTPAFQANRHQALDVTGQRSVEQPPSPQSPSPQPASPQPPSPPQQHVDPLQGGRPASGAQPDPVSDALREVAAALAKLADALQRARF
ncbi:MULTISPECIES: hypothetical protein [Gordonia]|uniref:hypothetical protein n=1 Tax=Gordonia TaxID=2053 RepID=UPI0002E050EB|nr:MULTISPECIES: hypothetical protein [Gordonia]MCM3894452.1 hypothetical protein [Gordonia sputi]NKY94850.1 hypothetical protein [Gordonia sputi]OBA32422.1 hypothetical protein A5766_12830 [Gordonia sp. 852002-51296_SCH5728562-b]OBA74449.1 hypothetical protein A5777_08840 [Gordonia sp. 852002-10350_SCH5691597]